MSQNDIRSQCKREQDERRKSLQISSKSLLPQPANITNAENAFLPTEIARSCFRSLSLSNQSQQVKTTTTNSLNIPEIYFAYRQ